MQILGIGLMALVTDSINAMFRHLQKRICNIVDQQGVPLFPILIDDVN